MAPRAYILNATRDPLGSLAALNAIYTGGVRRSLGEVTDEERREALREVFKNKLQGPLESIQFHILFEGVTRSFTHQHVRGRHAFYGQESMRFAVVEGERWTDRVAYPPSLAREPETEPVQDFPGGPILREIVTADEQYAADRDLWDDSVITAQNAYTDLVNRGYPAEDIRGLMPHAMTTRIHWICSLRELLYVAGVRLCTQAQFEWRLVMASLVQELRRWADSEDGSEEDSTGEARTGWQFREIANLMRPICYQEGACGFKAKADRACSIRERVDFREKHSLDRKDTAHWHKPMIADVVRYGYPDGRPYVSTETSPGIDPAEWLADPNAAR